MIHTLHGLLTTSGLGTDSRIGPPAGELATLPSSFEVTEDASDDEPMPGLDSDVGEEAESAEEKDEDSIDAEVDAVISREMVTPGIPEEPNTEDRKFIKYDDDPTSSPEPEGDDGDEEYVLTDEEKEEAEAKEQQHIYTMLLQQARQEAQIELLKQQQKVEVCPAQRLRK